MQRFSMMSLFKRPLFSLKMIGKLLNTRSIETCVAAVQGKDSCGALDNQSHDCYYIVSHLLARPISAKLVSPLPQLLCCNLTWNSDARGGWELSFPWQLPVSSAPICGPPMPPKQLLRGSRSDEAVVGNSFFVRGSWVASLGAPWILQNGRTPLLIIHLPVNHVDEVLEKRIEIFRPWLVNSQC